MLSPKTMELERVSGVNTENPMHGYQIKSVHSDSWLIYAHLLAGGLGRWFARFIFVQNWLHKPPPVWTCTIARPFHVFHPHRCQKFHYVISSYIRSHPWATAVLEAEPCSQEASSISKFKISVWHSSLARSTGALPEDCWHPNWHPWISSIHTWTILIWSTCALPTLTSVSHSSHWLTGIQEESPLQMSKTRMNSEITCFNKNVLRWLWQRHVQNSCSCKSRKLWRWERDIKHPLKSGNPNTHWICWTWQKRKKSYKTRLNFMELNRLRLLGKTLQNGYNIGCVRLHSADVYGLPGCRGRWEKEAVFVSAFGEHGVSHHWNCTIPMDKPG